MTKKIFIKNSKGLQLAGIIEVPDAKAPFVILLHGFTGYKEEEHISTLAEDLADAGIGSIRFDASGFGESEGTIEKDFRFTNYLADTKDVYRWLLAQSFVDATRIAVWGHSLGGRIALCFASQHPELKAVCYCQGGRTMFHNWKPEELENWKISGWLEKQSSKFGLLKIPYAYYEERGPFNSLDLVRSVHTPTLLVSGTEDEIVPARDVKEIFEVANEPKEYFECQSAGHDYKKSPKLLKIINRRTVEFFTKNLK